jgi:hypothetical protein
MIAAHDHVADGAPPVDQQTDLTVHFLGKGGQIMGQFEGDDLLRGDLSAVKGLELSGLQGL